MLVVWFWNQLKSQHLCTPGRDFLGQTIPDVSHNFLPAQIREDGGGSVFLPACLYDVGFPSVHYECFLTIG